MRSAHPVSDRRRALLAALACTLAPSLGAAESPALIEFAPEDWMSIRAGLERRPAIVHLWGVTCAPCLEELPRWDRLVARHPDAQIVFVHLDAVPPARVAATLKRVGLARGRQLALRGTADERLRYRIDPTWGGELPRTLLTGAGGAVQMRFSGSADFAALERWLAQSAKPV